MQLSKQTNKQTFPNGLMRLKIRFKSYQEKIPLLELQNDIRGSKDGKYTIFVLWRTVAFSNAYLI